MPYIGTKVRPNDYRNIIITTKFYTATGGFFKEGKESFLESMREIITDEVKANHTARTASLPIVINQSLVQQCAHISNLLYVETEVMDNQGSIYQDMMEWNRSG